MKRSIMIACVMAGLCAVSYCAPGHGGPPWAQRDRPAGDDMTTVIADRMAKKLDLTEEQKQQVDKILADTRSDLERIDRERKDRLQKSHDAIAGLLKPEQKEQFEKMRPKFDKRPGDASRRGKGLWRGGERGGRPDAAKELRRGRGWARGGATLRGGAGPGPEAGMRALRRGRMGWQCPWGPGAGECWRGQGTIRGRFGAPMGAWWDFRSDARPRHGWKAPSESTVPDDRRPDMRPRMRERLRLWDDETRI